MDRWALGAVVPCVSDRDASRCGVLPPTVDIDGPALNFVRHVDRDAVQYRTDTEGGSSGSPVFDNQWRLVALHHGQTSNSADPQGFNQGTRVSRAVEGLAAAGIGRS
ncbi:trypsin-like peptidase domain-containing protein [Nocardia salmonicida]|uniref:trypsin-like peptidase domain-containing protein n=1 Tax=Nocardia salmonicida TaxID=53431 RepID=UPI00366D3EDA